VREGAASERLGSRLAIAGAIAALYSRVLRDSILNWGATDAEAAARLSGDKLLEHAEGVSTSAIEIDAPTAAVWPSRG
jgi:hypothetical protein